MKQLVSPHASKALFSRDALQPDRNYRDATCDANAIADVATRVHG